MDVQMQAIADQLKASAKGAPQPYIDFANQFEETANVIEQLNARTQELDDQITEFGMNLTRKQVDAMYVEIASIMLQVVQHRSKLQELFANLCRLDGYDADEMLNAARAQMS